MMKKPTGLLVLLICAKTYALNVPLYNACVTNQLQTINPAFHGMFMTDGRKSGIEAGNLTLYSYRMSNMYGKFPAFLTLIDNGFQDQSYRYKKNALQNNLFITARQQISDRLSIGYGGALNRTLIDNYSNGMGLDLGLSIIAKNNKGAHFSLGVNYKFDHYNYQFTHLDNHVSDEKANVNNLDIGLGYLSKNGLFKAGLSCFNLMETTIQKSESTNMFEGPYCYTGLSYSRLFLLNLVKQSYLNHSKTLSLDYSLYGLFSHSSSFDVEDLMVNLGLSKKIKSQQFGLGMTTNNFYFTYDLINLGFYLKYSLKHFDLMYSNETNFTGRSGNSGLNYLSLKARF